MGGWRNAATRQYFALGCLIASAARVRATSYDALARDALGGAGEIAVIFGQFVFDYGAALSYLIILGDTSESVVEFALKRHAPGSLIRLGSRPSGKSRWNE